MAHTNEYVVRLGERGRLVLPAELRRRAGLKDGDDLVVFYGDGVVRLIARRDLARAGRGMFADIAPGRDLIAELVAERREEARKEGRDKQPRRPARRR